MDARIRRSSSARIQINRLILDDDIVEVHVIVILRERPNEPFTSSEPRESPHELFRREHVCPADDDVSPQRPR